MPITQSRMISMIRAAQTWEAAWRDLRALVAASVAQHRRGAITTEELYAELATAAMVTEIPAKHQIVIATEAQHFAKNERKNESAKIRSERHRDERAIKRPRRQKQGMPLPAITIEAAAKATAPAFAPGVNPLAGFASELPPNPFGEAPTPEQLAADDALFASADEDELAAHIASLRKGEQ